MFFRHVRIHDNVKLMRKEMRKKKEIVKCKTQLIDQDYSKDMVLIIRR